MKPWSSPVETVYMAIDFECEECGVLKSDITPDAPMCDCDADDFADIK